MPANLGITTPLVAVPLAIVFLVLLVGVSISLYHNISAEVHVVAVVPPSNFQRC